MPKITCSRALIDLLLKHKPADILRRITHAMADSGCRWWWVHDGQAEQLILDRQRLWLWQGHPNLRVLHRLEHSKKVLMTLRLSGLDGWQLPTLAVLKDAAQNGFPLLEGEGHRLKNCRYFLAHEHAVDLDDFKPHHEGRLLATRPFPTAIDEGVVVRECLQRGWILRAHDADTPVPQLMRELRSPYLEALAFVPGKSKQLPSELLVEIFQQLDAHSLPLPRLPIELLTDSTRGLWELHSDLLPATDQVELLINEPLRSRDPALDVQPGYVAIDFGSSSTVVAYRERGQDRLLQMGLSDYRAPVKAKDYENPTVLECVDLLQFLSPWQAIAYRPPTQWDDLKVSHAAFAHFRDRHSDAAIVRSVLFRLKQWALRDAQGVALCVTDQRNHHEQAIAPLQRTPSTPGVPLVVGPNDPFNPIEVYAYYLGLALNARQRGLFLNYCLTFPVAYPQPVKDKILSAFHRGLQRSLPLSLVYNKAVFGQFTVEERAAEPVAYAVAAFETLELTPTAQGVAYAVFDFGGGTTDFDYGCYRLANDAELDEGYETVIEHFGASGDRFLGAENILENLAYRVFQVPENLETCRQLNITFQKPFDADHFPGSDAFLERTQASLTNMVLLTSQLRPLWETPDDHGLGDAPLALRLVDREGVPRLCTLTLPVAALRHYLEDRLERGVQSFYLGLHAAFIHAPTGFAAMARGVEILLAGNGSRSPLIAALFATPTAAMDLTPTAALTTRMHAFRNALFAEGNWQFRVHPPLPMDDDHPYRPTAKTGVALGLLRLCPGEPIRVIHHDQAAAAPVLRYFVGKIVRQKFVPVLQRGDTGTDWVEVGALRDGVFYLVYTSSPLAVTGDMPHSDPDLTTIALRFSGLGVGYRVFVRLVTATAIESCVALRDQGEMSQPRHLQRHELRRDT